MADSTDTTASTPAATAGVAQTKDADPADRAGRAAAAPEDNSARFDVSDVLERHALHRTYQRTRDDPIYRPLRIFAIDPGLSKLDGAIALLNVPYEPLQPGPSGKIFRVERDDAVCDLESPVVLLQNGYAPSRSDPRFHHQMVYAVCSSVHAAFRTALGRDPVWGFDARQDDEGNEETSVLLLKPHAFEGRNAHYDKTDGSLNFGYFTSEEDTRDRLKGEKIFTCLSHDIISHELTHALLDGLRPKFTIPTRVDVLAFHEAFADLVAVLQHFTYRQVVLSAIRRSRGKITDGLLTDLARTLGGASDRPSALRSALDRPARNGDPVQRYDPALPIHDLGAVLLAAVFDAFNTVYERKTARYIRLATGGTGQLPMGELSADLQDVLAEEASQLASQFLSICIRAIDYSPPVDLDFGEFLRAVITADRELVPDDPWAYREAWIDAFRERGIMPVGVTSLDEDSLLWHPPASAMDPIRPLRFARLRFSGDPGRAASGIELRRQARALGKVVGARTQTECFGLLPVGERNACAPKIESIRSARRVGPDGQIVFDIVAEISQHWTERTPGGRPFAMHGGSTVILGPEGEIRYVIGKGGSARRVDSVASFIDTPRGLKFWEEQQQRLEPRSHTLRQLHED